MTSASAPRRTPLVLTLVMLFLIADVGVPLMSNNAVLDEAPNVARATAQLSPVQDVGILSTATTSSEGADTADIGDLGSSGEGRLLLEFNLGLLSLIHI